MSWRTYEDKNDGSSLESQLMRQYARHNDIDIRVIALQCASKLDVQATFIQEHAKSVLFIAKMFENYINGESTL